MKCFAVVIAALLWCNSGSSVEKGNSTVHHLRAAPRRLQIPYETLVAIRKGPTDSGKTEVRLLAIQSEHVQFSPPILTAFSSSQGRGKFSFGVSGNGHLVRIERSGKTMVSTVTKASNYNSYFHVNRVTPLGDTSDASKWTFLVALNGDVFAISRAGTGSGKTEVFVLAVAQNYELSSHHFVTGLHATVEADPTKDQFSFALKNNRDLVFIKRGPHTGTGQTEVHILSAASNYQTFTHHVGTPLHLTFGFDQWQFLMTDDDNLLMIDKGPTGSGVTEGHALSAASGYKEFTLHTAIKGLPYTTGQGVEWEFALRP